MIIVGLYCVLKGYSNFGFQLTGSGFQAYNNHLIYLKYSEIKDGLLIIEMDSVLIREGSFNFQGILKNPACLAEFSIKKAKQQYYFVLDTGKIHVRPQKNIKLSQLIIPNSETNKLRNSINRMYSQLVLNGKPIQRKSISDIKLIEFEMIKKEQTNFYSLLALKNLEGSTRLISTEDIANAFYGFDDQIKKTSLGIYLEKRFKNALALYPGNVFPDFEFKDVKGEFQKSDTLKEKTYLIAFGASWCGPCQKAIPELVNLQKSKDSSIFQIVYINMDSNISNWLRMIDKYGMYSFLNLSDTLVNGELSPMYNKFSIHFIPYYLVIDKNKVIKYNSYLLLDENYSIRNNVISETLKSASNNNQPYPLLVH